MGTALTACAVALLFAVPVARSATPSPSPQLPTPTPTVHAAATISASPSVRPAVAANAPASATPTPAARRASTGASSEVNGEAPSDARAASGSAGDASAPAATAAIGPPRVFRTPERNAPPAFVAPQSGTETDAGEAPAAPAPMAGNRGAGPRATSGLVILRATARTALEGFDVRVSYPTSMGAFGTGAQGADCNAGNGVLVVANDRGMGEMRVLVASASALPLPLDVFCRFTVAPGATFDASAFTAQVAEVTSNGKRADPTLLLVSIAAR